jgi:hypothetical protein
MNISLIANGQQTVPHKKDILMDKLNIFYRDPQNINYILPILNGKSRISLRLIDWFITNFAKKYNTKIICNDNINTIKQFIVFINYKAQLKSYTKKQFDPFCRRERLRFFYNTERFIITTVGQLNFFKWAIENKIIDFINENMVEIETDMNNNVKKIKSLDPHSRKKRQELSISASKSLNKHNINITVSFE